MNEYVDHNKKPATEVSDVRTSPSMVSLGQQSCASSTGRYANTTRSNRQSREGGPRHLKNVTDPKSDY